VILYLDTSALVKLYVQEVGSADVNDWLKDADAAATSWVAYAEARAAFARGLREGITGREHHAERVGQFNLKTAVGGLDGRRGEPPPR